MRTALVACHTCRAHTLIVRACDECGAALDGAANRHRRKHDPAFCSSACRLAWRAKHRAPSPVRYCTACRKPLGAGTKLSKADRAKPARCKSCSMLGNKNRVARRRRRKRGRR